MNVERGGVLEVQWVQNDRNASRFESLWLVHNSPSAKHSSSGQKLISPASLAHAPRLRSAKVNPASSCVDCHFDDGSVHSFPLAFLRVHSNSDAHLAAAVNTAEPQAATIRGLADIPSFSFASLMDSDVAVHAWLQTINQQGMAMVSEVPTHDGAVLKLASRVAAPMTTIYGTKWDVESTADPINVAYSSLPLELHCDLVSINCSRVPYLNLNCCESSILRKCKLLINSPHQAL